MLVTISNFHFEEPPFLYTSLHFEDKIPALLLYRITLIKFNSFFYFIRKTIPLASPSEYKQKYNKKHAGNISQHAFTIINYLYGFLYLIYL